MKLNKRELISVNFLSFLCKTKAKKLLHFLCSFLFFLSLPSPRFSHSFHFFYVLQGPLPKVGHGGEEDIHAQVEESEGRAVSLLYNAISKDSILVTAWSGGQLQVDALADEIQPVWIVGTPPRVCFDSHDRIIGVAMICESVTGDHSALKLYEPSDHTVWSGYPPPLLRLAMVDLALPRNRESTSLISMVSDPLIPERMFVLHDGGIDFIVLHFLPFTSQTSSKNESMRTPSVHPVLCTSQGGYSSPLFGFLALSDSFGYSWIVGLTSSRECIVLEMKTWDLLLPVHVEREGVATLDESRVNDNPVISKELLSGPKVVLLPPSSNLRSVTADSIEGRSTLHQYFKLFHENYVEYAHKVTAAHLICIQPFLGIQSYHVHFYRRTYLISFCLSSHHSIMLSEHIIVYHFELLNMCPFILQNNVPWS